MRQRHQGHHHPHRPLLLLLLGILLVLLLVPPMLQVVRWMLVLIPTCPMVALGGEAAVGV
jgi:hypothetical protein